MVSTARPFLFSSSQPPSVIATCLAGLDVIENEPERLKALWDNTHYFKQALKDAGFDSIEAAKEDGTAFVFMGHGTHHTAMITYSQMQTQMNELGYDNVFIGTVEGDEAFLADAIIENVAAAGYTKVVLRPLMVVAGDHANNDMAGAEEDAWLAMFNASGKFESVDAQVEGLGQIEAIQQIYVDHTAAVLK